MSNAINGTVTKSELIERISEKLKLPNGKAEQIVNCVFDSMVKALQEGEGIEIQDQEGRSFGLAGRTPENGSISLIMPFCQCRRIGSPVA